MAAHSWNVQEGTQLHGSLDLLSLPVGDDNVLSVASEFHTG